MTEPIDDILQWSKSRLSPWRQDALRRLACSDVLTSGDRDELLDMVKEKAGFTLAGKPVGPVPLAKTHLSGANAGSALKLKAIRNVKNVNRLVPAASLAFAPKGLTIIYGRNGSGKSGFVRIFRTACRTRIEDQAKLRVLADVYGSGGGPQEAEIIIDVGAGDTVVPWKSGAQASDALLQVAVFDSGAAQLYVDAGNQIRFLPFGLALPHKLNELCLALKDRLDTERSPIVSQLQLADIAFEIPRSTKAQTFCGELGPKTSDQEITEAATFSKDDEARLTELTRLLVTNSASVVDLRALSKWAESLAGDCSAIAEVLSDVKLSAFGILKQQAVEARSAASLNAEALFATEPLMGIGGETWRRLWLAARDYSISDAFVGREFPVLSEGDEVANCVLCQQPLGAEASDRLKRFQAFVGGVLAEAADTAELAVMDALKALPILEVLSTKDWALRIEQVNKRDPGLSAALTAFKASATERVERAKTVLRRAAAADANPLATLFSPDVGLNQLAGLLTKEAETLAAAEDDGQRVILSNERAEITDRKVLAAGVGVLTTRRDLLKLDAFYTAALAEVQTKGITQKANELVDTHLTKAVVDRFKIEQKTLEITHLKVCLSRKSGQTKAAFQTNPGTTLTKTTSEILSEGEQRALALAAFLTEIAITDGAGPIVVDDPVSSLDRERGLKVAARLAEEAVQRQVIVFTHDLIFFNDLCREADERGVPMDTIALFSDGANAGKIDPAGVAWKGLSVRKRLGQIRNDFMPLKKLHGTSPSEYEFRLKHLYGRLRDTYERVVEECIFCDVVRRGVDRIETQRLRSVHLSDALAIRFHNGMTKANTYSHDNPAAGTVPVPDPGAFEADLAFIESLIADLKSESVDVESKRPSMKPKN